MKWLSPFSLRKPRGRTVTVFAPIIPRFCVTPKKTLRNPPKTPAGDGQGRRLRGRSQPLHGLSPESAAQTPFRVWPSLPHTRPREKALADRPTPHRSPPIPPL